MSANTDTRLAQLETRAEEFLKKSDVAGSLARIENEMKWLRWLLILSLALQFPDLVTFLSG